MKDILDVKGSNQVVPMCCEEPTGQPTAHMCSFLLGVNTRKASGWEIPEVCFKHYLLLLTLTIETIFHPICLMTFAKLIINFDI